MQKYYGAPAIVAMNLNRGGHAIVVDQQTLDQEQVQTLTQEQEQDQQAQRLEEAQQQEPPSAPELADQPLEEQTIGETAPINEMQERLQAEALQESILQNQAVEQEQTITRETENTESIERNQTIDAEQSELSDRYDSALEAQEAAAIQKNEETPSLTNNLVDTEDTESTNEQQLNGEDIDKLIVDMPFEELLKQDESFRVRALLKVEGIPEDDLMQILSLKDDAVRNDLINIALTVDHATNQMTEEGQRIEWTTGNNTLRAIVNRDNAAREEDNLYRERANNEWRREAGVELSTIELITPVKDCGEQAEHVNEKLRGMLFNEAWTFKWDTGVGHAWGMALPDSPEKPYLTFDPRARSFGFDRNCDTCKPWFGKRVSDDLPKWQDPFPGVIDDEVRAKRYEKGTK